MTFNRNRQIQKIDENNSEYDVCIIGGGATGAGVALDATLRGYKVLLIEKGDFAGQTSSKSTKLVHGGVRYLEQAVKTFDWDQFKMVYKALHERQIMLKNAPHLAHPLGLLTPCYSWFDRLYYRIGMWMYDKIAGSTNLKSSLGMGPKEIERLIPALDTKGMKGGILYYDGQLNDARYALAILQTAEQQGATILNYAALHQFTISPKSLKVKKLHFKDLLSGKEHEISAKAFINATGPFTDAVRKMANPKLHARMKVSRGAHIVLKKEFWPGELSLLIPKTDDGRVVFLIPWRDYVLVGTTDEADTLQESPAIQEDEKIYLLDYFNRFAKQKASMEDICSDFVGQRPLLQAALESTMNSDTKTIVRDHEVEFDQRSNLISIMGGKWTTYRVMAEDTVDVMENEIFEKNKSKCRTKNFQLIGGESIDSLTWEKTLEELTISSVTARHLQEIYGSCALKVLQYCQEQEKGLEPIIHDQPYLKGEIAYLKEFEMATSLDDILDRRWGIEIRDRELADQIRKKL
ncbi:glycerol-3-phosphate dehydrogenase/oxidase [Aquirufa sp. ROCK2-A2]